MNPHFSVFGIECHSDAICIVSTDFSLPNLLKPSYLHCNGTKVQQPKMRYQLICGLMSANPRGNKLLHSTWSISPRLKRHPFPRWVWSGVFLFLCQCNCWCWVVQLTLCRILCVARPELSCKIAHSCIGCTFHTWFSRLPGISCANVH